MRRMRKLRVKLWMLVLLACGVGGAVGLWAASDSLSGDVRVVDRFESPDRKYVASLVVRLRGWFDDWTVTLKHNGEDGPGERVYFSAWV